jgi:hypothetical protein
MCKKSLQDMFLRMPVVVAVWVPTAARTKPITADFFIVLDFKLFSYLKKKKFHEKFIKDCY